MYTHTRTQVIKGTELPRQTVPRAPGAESPALQVTLVATGSTLVLPGPGMTAAAKIETN